MKTPLGRLCVIVLGLFGWTSPALAQNQTPTVSPILSGADLPFRVSIERADFSLPVGLQGLELVTAFTARIVVAAADAAAAPAYVRAQPPTAGEPRRGGYGPVFGVVPDFGESAEPGARISGVRPGSPAEKAGMRAGDIIVQFAGVTVKTLDDLTFALRGQRAGQRVEIVVVRDKQQHRMEAVLEERR